MITTSAKLLDFSKLPIEYHLFESELGDTLVCEKNRISICFDGIYPPKDFDFTRREDESYPEFEVRRLDHYRNRTVYESKLEYEIYSKFFKFARNNIWGKNGLLSLMDNKNICDNKIFLINVSKEGIKLIWNKNYLRKPGDFYCELQIPSEKLFKVTSIPKDMRPGIFEKKILKMIDGYDFYPFRKTDSFKDAGMNQTILFMNQKTFNKFLENNLGFHSNLLRKNLNEDFYYFNNIPINISNAI